MYPGVGPDGVYRLHAGLYKTNRALDTQLHEGGNKVNADVFHGFRRRRDWAEQSNLILAARRLLSS